MVLVIYDSEKYQQDSCRSLVGKVLTFDDRNLNSFSYKELSTRMAVVLTERMRPELMTCHDIVATGRYPYTGRLGILSERMRKR